MSLSKSLLFAAFLSALPLSVEAKMNVITSTPPTVQYPESDASTDGTVIPPKPSLPH